MSSVVIPRMELAGAEAAEVRATLLVGGDVDAPPPPGLTSALWAPGRGRRFSSSG